MSKHKRPIAICQVCAAGMGERAFMCRTCERRFAEDLGEIGWLAEELDTSCAGERAMSYSPVPTKGGTPGAPEVNWQAIEARRDLMWTIARGVAWAAHIEIPGPSLISSGLTGQAEFLRARVGAISGHRLGPLLAQAVGDAVDRARRAVDCPPDDVPLEDREKRLRELEDRLCTAAEIAQLSTYLGLRDDRERVRKRVNTWHKRGRIAAHPGPEGEVRFRFGSVWAELALEDDKTG